MKPSTIIVIILVVLILFGSTKLPDIARSVGKSMRVFKSEVDELKSENEQKRTAAGGESTTGAAAPTSAESQATATPPVERAPDSHDGRTDGGTVDGTPPTRA